MLPSQVRVGNLTFDGVDSQMLHLGDVDGDLRDGNDDEDINEEAGKLGGWRMMWWK